MLSSQGKFEFCSIGMSFPEQSFSSASFSDVSFLKLNHDMTSEAIVKQVEAKDNSEKTLNIHFKQRSTIKGLFIKGNDYKDLKSKNLWRIVTNTNIDQWKKTKDINLARIFNG